MSQVRNNLTHPRFILVEEEDEADIIWNYDHIKDYRLAPHTLVRAMEEKKVNRPNLSKQKIFDVSDCSLKVISVNLNMYHCQL